MFVAFPLRLVLTALAVCAVVFSVELVPAPSRGKSPERSVGGVPVCSCRLSYVSVSPPSSWLIQAGVVEEIDSVVFLFPYCCRDLCLDR